MNEALAFQLTTRGIPVIYYGDEQYLHNDTGGGGDPYNRPQMTSFDTTSTAYKVIAALAGLRQTNDAIAYGTTKQRWISGDVYVYERQFFNDVVLVAINKNNSDSCDGYKFEYGAAGGDVMRIFWVGRCMGAG